MEPENPYAAPMEMGVEAEWHPPEPTPIASSDQRVITLIADSIPFGAMFIALIVTLVRGTLLDLLFVCATTLVLWFLYYYLCELVYSKTLGKLIAGTRVITTQGEVPGPSHILLRTLARLIPFDFLFFLGEQGHPIGLHDWLSGTVVVSEKKWRGVLPWLPAVENSDLDETTASDRI